VILACNGVGTPRLMLNSVSAKFPNGIATPPAGRQELMFHPYALTYGYVDEPLDGNHGPPLCLWSQNSTRPTLVAISCAAIPFSSAAASARSWKRSSVPRRKAALGRRTSFGYRKLVNRRIGLSAICEDLPEEHNRVTLDPVLKDSSGIPAPKLDYTISANSHRMMQHGIARAKEVLTAPAPVIFASRARS